MFQTNLALPLIPDEVPDVVTGRHDVATENEETRNSNSRINQDTTLTNPTFNDALNARGGGINQLARESVAAMLNAAHVDINYNLDVNVIMEMTQLAIIDEDYKATIIKFRQYNNALGNSLCLN